MEMTATIYRLDYSDPDLIDQLPDTALRKIFEYLTIVDRIRIQRVSRRWRQISKLAWSSTTCLILNDGTWGFHDRSREQYITIHEFKHVLSLCGPNLTDLHIRTWYNNRKLAPFFREPESRSILGYVARTCFRLRNLTFEHPSVSLWSFKMFVQLCPSVETITLSGQMGKIGMLTKLCSNRKLCYLHVRNNRHFTASCLRYVCPLKLRVIRIEYCASFKLQLNCYTHNNLLLRFKNLEAFEWNCAHSSTSMYCIPRQALKCLTLKIDVVTDLFLVHQSRHLQFLHLCVTTMTDYDLTLIAKYCTELKYFYLAGHNKISKEGVLSVFQLPLLEDCTFKDVGKLDFDILDEIDMPQMRRFVIDGSIHTQYGYSVERLIKRSHRLAHISLQRIGIEGANALDFILRVSEAIRWRKPGDDLLVTIKGGLTAMTTTLTLQHGAKLKVVTASDVEL